MIYVIGAANIDVYAKSDKEIILEDSNIGSIKLTYGGVANNIACNLKALGEDPKFVTAFGDDYFSELLLNDLNKKHIDISLSNRYENCNSPIYLAVLDNQNDMSVGINDMKIIEKMNADSLDRLKNLVSDKDYVVLDCNLSSEALEFVLNEVKGTKIVEAISVNKVSRIVPFLNKVDIIKLNTLEASSICGMDLVDSVKMLAFMKLMKNEGVKEVLVSTRKGLFIGSSKGVEFYKHNYKNINVVNASGAGDALLSGYVYGKYHGSNNKSCATLGLISAIITLGDDRTNGVINKNDIKNLINETKVEGGFVYEY